MSILGRTIESSIKKGQESIEVHVAQLSQQNEQIIENLNDIMKLQKKICDKLEIEAELEEAD